MIEVVDFRPGETATGPQGPAGMQGAKGYSVLSGSGVPSPLLGVNNDQYINNADGSLFKKIAGAWVYQSSLLGPSFSVGQVDGGNPSSIYGGTFVVFGGVP